MMASTVVPVGLIANEQMFPLSKKIVEKAIEDIKVDAKYIVDIGLPSGMVTGTPGCGTGKNTANGAKILFDDFYKLNIKAVFGPMCQADLEIAGRATTEWDITQFNVYQDHPSDVLQNNIVQMTTKNSLNTAINLKTIMKLANWGKIATIVCKDCYSEGDSIDSRVQTIERYLEQNKIHTVYRTYVFKNWTDVEYQEMMVTLKENARIFVPFLGLFWEKYIMFARAMNSSRLPAEEYLAIYPMLFEESTDANLPWSADPTVRNYFYGSVLIYNDFLTQVKINEITTKLGMDNVDKETLLLYMQLYESVFVYTWALGRIPPINGTADYNGAAVRNVLTTETVNGPFGEIFFASHSIRLTPYTMKYVRLDNGSVENMSTIKITAEVPCGNASDATNSSLFKCYTLTGTMDLSDFTFSLLPQDMPSCGFRGELCDQTGTVIIIAAVMTALVIAIGVFMTVRKMKSGETAAMPWAVSIGQVKMVDVDAGLGSQQMSIHSLQQHIENKSKMRELLRTRQLATIDQAYVVIESYNLKEKLVFDKSELHWLFLMKQIVHDNLNPFMGLCFDRSQHLYVMWSHCFRGTLTDMIFEGKKDDTSPAFDNNFKGAFVRDLLKGLDFIHSSSIHYHGMLTPSHCCIDSHWILKLSGFGMSKMLFKWKNSSVISTLDGSPLIPNSELHYYAPEIRRALKALMYTNRNEHIQLTNKQGQAADIFAFGMVLFEIVFRKKVIDIDESLQSEDDNLILCEQAEAQVPSYPTIPEQIGTDVHPDLIGLMHKCWTGQVEQRPDATLARKITDATLKMSGSLVDQMIKNMEQYTNNLENLVKERTGQLEDEQKKAEALLTELLPKSVADELKVGRRVDAKTFKSATILYSDIVGFTSLCSESEPMEVVALLSGMFQSFDRIIAQHKAYKCETIGDAYMVASGVPIQSKTEHVRDIASVALQQREFLYDFEIPHRPGQFLHCRWGFNTGSVFTGVVGISAPRYCVFGPTVSIAAKMESTGIPDKIQISLKSYQLLTARFPEFKCSNRGSVKIEGIGTLLTYWLDGVEDLLRSDRDSYRQGVAEEERRAKTAQEIAEGREAIANNSGSSSQSLLAETTGL